MRNACVLMVSLLGCLAAGQAGAAYWKPSADTSFSIILSVSPAIVDTPAKAVDLDLFDTGRGTIHDLKKKGKRAICYMSAGSWENWRPDKNDFPSEVIGKPYDGWPGERWLDISNIAALAPVMRKRLDLCKAKGFDAVDPDNIDAYQAKTGSGSPAPTRSAT